MCTDERRVVTSMDLVSNVRATLGRRCPRPRPHAALVQIPGVCEPAHFASTEEHTKLSQLESGGLRICVLKKGQQLLLKAIAKKVRAALRCAGRPRAVHGPHTCWRGGDRAWRRSTQSGALWAPRLSLRSPS